MIPYALLFVGTRAGLWGVGAPLAALVTTTTNTYDLEGLLVFLPVDALDCAAECLKLFLVGFLAAAFANVANLAWQNTKHLFDA